MPTSPTVIALWQALRPDAAVERSGRDIALARRGPHSTVLIGRDGDAIVATAMVGHDGHRGWVYYVAVDPDRRAKGYGRAIMNAAEDWLRATRHCQTAIDGAARQRQASQAFYQSIGYAKQADASCSPNGSTAASRHRDEPKGIRMTISDRVRVKNVRVLSDRHYQAEDRRRSTGAATMASGRRRTARVFDRGNAATLLPYNLAQPHRGAGEAVPLSGLSSTAMTIS